MLLPSRRGKAVARSCTDKVDKRTSGYLMSEITSTGDGNAVAGTPDELLIQRIAAGDKAAMQTLFARHQLKMYRFVLRIVSDATLAEDAVSETFLEVWQHAGTFQGRSSVATWLLGIARYKALATQRRRPTVSLDCKSVQNVVDPVHDPEAELGQQDTRTAIRRALAALSREHAEILDLVYYQEKSIREIAEVLGIPENTVKTRMFYARKRLAAIIGAAGIKHAAA